MSDIRCMRGRRVDGRVKPGHDGKSRYATQPASYTTRIAFLLMVPLGLTCPGPARAECVVQARATVTFTPADGVMFVPVNVNGSTARFVIDTGAERSMVTPEAVQRLDLALDPWVGTAMHGVGGGTEHQNARPRSIALGGVPLQRHTITHDTSLVVGPLPRFAGQDYDGLLGRDFLSVFDLDFDMPAHRLTLYDVRGCSGRFLPWTTQYDAIRAETPMAHALVLPMQIDGHPLRALLDTGASATLIALPGIIRLGLTPALMAGDQARNAHGVGPQAPEMRQHRFAMLRIDGETQRDPMLWVARVRLTPIVDVLLGGDWLMAQRRIWISFATSQVFVATQ